MPIDPSIPLQLQPIKPYSPMDSYGRALTLRNLMRSGQLDDERLAAAQAEREAAQRAQANDLALQRLISTKPNATEAEIIEAGGVKGGGAYLKSRADAQKVQTEAEAKSLELQQARLEPMRRAAMFMKSVPVEQRGAVWPQVRDRLRGLGMYDPAQISEGLPDDSEFDQVIAFTTDPEVRQKMLLAAQAEARAQAGETRAQERFTAEMPGVKADSELKVATAAGQAPIQPVDRERLDAQKAEAEATTAYRKAMLAETRRGHDLSYTATMSTGGRQAAAANAGNESKLRDDYRQDSKNYATVRDSYGRIMEASKSQTGPGDISLLYGYMRILDPGSTVREGEFATAQNAGSIPDSVRAAYNKAISGQRLAPNVRQQFVAEAQRIFSRATADHEKMKGWYRETAKRSGMNPDNVLVDYGSSVSGGTVKMRAPNGEVSDVPADQVSHFEKLGAKRL